ncbi:MAG: Adenylate kinase (EC [uncultured Sulfurovum sp.]|uniref:Adenylate kinase n=1 Tax=uncultured Sulfurovum sp. TaxID=269237 RepID=A0A6S6UCS0_9BACT|nr:MAG: Adenylate kinase (EC [uncultured Sulfurovum sp.]
MCGGERMTKKLFLLIGAPGSGKTTDAQIIASRHKENVTHYSTGDILREEVESASELGQTINNYIKEGALVPLNIIMNTVFKAIKNSPTEVVLIDGYPRSVEQMIELDKVLEKEEEIKLVSVIEVQVSEAVAKQRILGRVAESTTVRSDDNMEIFQNRMKVYTEPLAEIQEFYTNKKLLKTFDGEKSIDIIISKMELYILTRL